MNGITKRNSKMVGNYVELALCVFTLVVLLHTAAVNADLENEVSMLNENVSYVQFTEEDSDNSAPQYTFVVEVSPVCSASPAPSVSTVNPLSESN